MSKDIKKALEHCIDNKCVGCPNNEELGSGDIVCRGRLLPEVLEYVADLEAKLAEKEGEIEDLKAQRRIYLNRSVEECNKITDLEFELQHKHQDKISFAVEQLEKVKENIHYLLSFDYNLVCRVNEQIDSQIKSLKGEE